MNPQETFLELLVAAMHDAVLEKKLTQLVAQLDPTGTGKGPMRRVRLIVVPEEMDHTWPEFLPAGAAGHG